VDWTASATAFGLVYVDFDTLERIAKLSADWFPRGGKAVTGWSDACAALPFARRLATVAAVVAPGAHADNGERALAERYTPVVRLVSQDEPCAHGKAYQSN
jgi:hypothetical protein